MMNENFDLGLFTGAFLGVFIIIAILLIAYAVAYIVALAKLFKKAGIEGWKAIIPFYNRYVFLNKVCGLHWAWFVVSLICTFSIIFTPTVTLAIGYFINAIAFYNLSIKCYKDKTASMIFGALAPEIMTMIYGFGSCNYSKYMPVKPSGLF